MEKLRLQTLPTPAQSLRTSLPRLLPPGQSSAWNQVSLLPAQMLDQVLQIPGRRERSTRNFRAQIRTVAWLWDQLRGELGRGLQPGQHDPFPWVQTTQSPAETEAGSRPEVVAVGLPRALLGSPAQAAWPPKATRSHRSLPTQVTSPALCRPCCLLEHPQAPTPGRVRPGSAFPPSNAPHTHIGCREGARASCVWAGHCFCRATGAGRPPPNGALRALEPCISEEDTRAPRGGAARSRSQYFSFRW